MAFSTLEDTRIGLELGTVFSESCPALKAAFLDHTDSYADNLTALNILVAALTDALFNETAPTVLP